VERESAARCLLLLARYESLDGPSGWATAVYAPRPAVASPLKIFYRKEVEMKKALSSLAALVILAAITVPGAAGSKPVIEPLPAEDFTIPANICGFEVGVHILGNKSKAIMFGDGRTMITGKLRVSLTNLDDPTRTIRLNIPGPGTISESGLTATGPWLFFFVPGELGEGSPAILAYTTGRVRIDDSGFHLLAGSRTDVCPLLASS
jgi:hypothetical protein